MPSFNSPEELRAFNEQYNKKLEIRAGLDKSTIVGASEKALNEGEVNKANYFAQLAGEEGKIKAIADHTQAKQKKSLQQLIRSFKTIDINFPTDKVENLYNNLSPPEMKVLLANFPAFKTWVKNRYQISRGSPITQEEVSNILNDVIPAVIEMGPIVAVSIPYGISGPKTIKDREASSVAASVPIIEEVEQPISRVISARVAKSKRHRSRTPVKDEVLSIDSAVAEADEDSLYAFRVFELKEYAKQHGIKIPSNSVKKNIVKIIAGSKRKEAEEEEEEEEEEKGTVTPERERGERKGSISDDDVPLIELYRRMGLEEKSDDEKDAGVKTGHGMPALIRIDGKKKLHQSTRKARHPKRR